MSSSSKTTLKSLVRYLKRREKVRYSHIEYTYSLISIADINLFIIIQDLDLIPSTINRVPTPLLFPTKINKYYYT